MTIDVENSLRAQKARELFLEGYNCSQSVFLAFEDLYEMDHSLALRLSSSFGGGMGRMREVCGAVSGMAMVAGAVYGYDDPKDHTGKAAHYDRVQKLALKFKDMNGSIVCRDLLGLGKDHVSRPTPEVRTPEYYKKRPCKEMVAVAAAIIEAYMNEQKENEEL